MAPSGVLVEIMVSFLSGLESRQLDVSVLCGRFISIYGTREVHEGGGHLVAGKFDVGKYHFWFS